MKRPAVVLYAAMRKRISDGIFDVSELSQQATHSFI